MAKSQIPLRFWNDQPGQGIGRSEVKKKSREDDKGLSKKGRFRHPHVTLVRYKM